MEKSSSLNIKSFRNLLSNQSKSYKIAPNNYHPTEVKLNGLNSTIDESSNSNSSKLDDIYSIKRNKSDSECSRRNLCDVICGNLLNLVGNCNSSFCLTVLTPVACSVSVIIIVAAIAGPLWITTEEKIPWSAVNSSFLYRSNNYSISYILKSSNASLWILCTRQALDDNRIKSDFTHKNCTKISYFSTEKYQPDPRDSSYESNYVIPYTITLSAPLLIISFIILLISYLLFLLAICSHKYKIFYFVAGIGFIISGLLSLSGLIMFISIFKSEAYHKLQPESYGKEPLFTFDYGQSFILYVIGFVVVELSGILNVCLFNKLQKIAQDNQNRFQLKNYVKVGLMNLEPSAANMCQHRAAAAFAANGYLPQQQPRRCSLHATPSNRKSVGDGFNNSLLTQHKQQVTHFDEFNQHVQIIPTSFKRNASTSTLDLVHGDGDTLSAQSNHRAITKDKSSVSNKINNICGMMGKSKDVNIGDSFRRLKPAKNVYYIEERKDDEPNIFIIDPSTVNKHKKLQIQKYGTLEDVRINKLNNSQHREYDNECDATIGWNFMDRNYYGSRSSKTLPRDFARRNARPSLDNYLNNFQHHSSEVDRSDPFSCKRQCLNKQNTSINNLFPPPPVGFAFHHSSSFDELSSAKLNRDFPCLNESFNPEGPQKTQQYQWPKVIPKSPSSFSMNSFRLHRQPPFNNVKCSQNYNPIDEFDLDKIESSFRQSHSTLLNENVNNTDFGTAV